MNTTPTPAHVALVSGLERALEKYVFHSSEESETCLQVARNALLNALAQPALAAPVLPVGFLNTVAALMKAIDAYAHDYQTDGKLAAMRGWVLVEIGTALAATQPTPAASREPHKSDSGECHYEVAPYSGSAIPGAGASASLGDDRRNPNTPTQVMQPVEASPSELRGALEMLYAETADYITLNNLHAMNNGCMVRARKALGISVEVAAPVAPTEPGDDDSFLLCASDLDNSAIYDNHVEMQACMRSVALRIAALSAAKPELLSDAQMAEVWIPYDQGIGSRRDLITRILKLQAGGAAS